jgi:hypothetical protein
VKLWPRIEDASLWRASPAWTSWFYAEGSDWPAGIAVTTSCVKCMLESQNMNDETLRRLLSQKSTVEV